MFSNCFLYFLLSLFAIVYDISIYSVVLVSNIKLLLLLLYRWNRMVPLSQHHRRVLLCHPANSAAWLYLVLRVHWDVWYMIIPDTFYSLPCHVMQFRIVLACPIPCVCACLHMRMSCLCSKNNDHVMGDWGVWFGSLWQPCQKAKCLHTQTAIGLNLNKLKQRVQCDSMVIYWFADEPKLKQTIEKLVSICRTVGMQTFYEGVCCTYLYIHIQYLQSQVAFFFQLADHVTELCSDKLKLAANGCFSDKASMICTPHCLFAD